MDLSVIIVNYNVKNFLHNALVSIQKAMQELSGEIFVVDNASDDGSGDMVQQFFPHVHCIKNAANLGFSRANNQALEQTKGRFIVLINPDTIVQEDTFHSLITFFTDHPKAGMVGCKILNSDGSLQLACRRSFPTPWVAFTKMTGLSTLFPNSRLFAKYNLTYLNPDENHEVDAISGSFMMIRREVYESIGGLDEQFFMYGEDLDWCYRAQQAGWKIYYTPSTRIIHYKGESTRRSPIDEVRTFYNAMRLFARKHHQDSWILNGIIEIGIMIRSGIAKFIQFLRFFLLSTLDGCIVVASILIAECIWMSHLFAFPSYAYPWALLIPALLVMLTLYFSGVYTIRRHSISRSILAVIMAYIILSALTAFFKTFAFSRVVVVISGSIALLLIPGWRIIARLMGAGEFSRKTLFGRRTLIVGAEQGGRELLRRLRSRIADGYTVVGLVDVSHQRIGEKVEDVEILGSIETIGKIIEDYRISDVIFSTGVISNTAILSIIARNRARPVNFRMVPSTMEVIIGKGSIDQLGEIPFIEIEYNLNRFANRLSKRLADLFISGLLLISIAPFLYLKRSFTNAPSNAFANDILLMPKVFLGKMSLIGRKSEKEKAAAPAGFDDQAPYLGKPGITGIVQIHTGENPSASEIEQLELYYAKNQSFLLDVEILMKTLLLYRRRSQ